MPFGVSRYRPAPRPVPSACFSTTPSCSKRTRRCGPPVFSAIYPRTNRSASRDKSIQSSFASGETANHCFIGLP